MNVSEMLKDEAIKYGLCVAWTNEWGSPTKEQLVDMYIKGLDFCILNNYPSNKFIKEHFGKIAEDKGVYTDKKLDIINPPIAILNGKCTGTITLSGFISRDIYVRHNSRIKIVIKDAAKASIRIYDNAYVTIENETGSRIFAYKYSTDSTIVTTGNVLIRQRSLSDL